MSFIAQLFSGGDKLKPPGPDSPEIQEARRRQLAAELRRQGRGASILTQGVGAPGNVVAPSLLGGGEV